MKKFKRWSWLVISLFLLCSTMVLFGCNNGTPKESVGLAYKLNEDGETCTIMGLGTCTETDIVIPQKIDGYKVTAIGDLAFVKNNNFDASGFGSFELEGENITSITIPSGITRIGFAAFAGCKNLKKVHIVDIESWLAISFDDSSSNPLLNGAMLYLNGELVTEIEIPNGITNINYGAFYGCSNLTHVTIPESVINLNEFAFYGCSNLTNVTIPDSVITVGDHTFDSCTNLASVTIGNGVTTIGTSAFENCVNLGNVSIGDNVAHIGRNAFLNCTNLANITIPEETTSIGERAFWGCDNLEKIVFPSSLLNIGTNALGSRIFNVLSIYYAGTVEEWGNNITFENEFDNMNLITYFYSESQPTLEGGYWHFSGEFPDVWDQINYISNNDGTCYIGCSYADENVIISAVSPTGDIVTTIGEWAFFGSLLPSITIPEGVTSIGDHAFNGCANLSNASLPDSITHIGDYAFAACNNLTRITIPDSVTSISDGAFTDCAGLTNITLGDSVTNIGDWAFSGCTSLTYITIPDSVKNIGSEAFSGCTGLKKVYYTGAATDWETTIIDSHNDALTSATRYYYSETYPTTEGNYWRYVNGVPTAW